MRKIIVKRFALDYICKAFGRIYFLPRASVIMYPICLTIILFIGLDWRIETFGVFEGFLLSILGVGIYLTFFYFKLHPFTLAELDYEQTYQYEIAIRKKVINFEVLTEEEVKKFFDANNFVKENIENKRNYKLYRLLYHPIVVFILSGVITYLYYF